MTGSIFGLFLDLDEQASAGAIEEMLRGRGSGRKANPEDLQPYSAQPDITSRFKSVSIQTVRRADGVSTIAFNRYAAGT